MQYSMKFSDNFYRSACGPWDNLEFWGASRFKTSNVAVVVNDEASFEEIDNNLGRLGFDVACSNSLEATFEVVSSDPEEWALIIIRLDQPFDVERIELYVKILRMMDHRVPVLLFSKSRFFSSESNLTRSFSDCMVVEPKSMLELSTGIGCAVRANAYWGARFGDFRGPTFARVGYSFER